MRPLLILAVGVLLVWLRLTVGGVDLAADPLGWLLVLAGLQRLPGRGRDLARGFALVALLVSLPLAVPEVAQRLADADPSLGWAVSLPGLGAFGCLAHHLGILALGGADAAAFGWFAAVRTGAIVLAILPVLAFTTGSDLVLVATALAQVGVLLTLVTLLLVLAERPWASGLDQSGPRPGTAS